MSGVLLVTIADLTASQRAGMDPSLAAALVQPLLDDFAVTLSDIMVTWEGRPLATGKSAASLASPRARREASVRAYQRLIGSARRAPFDDEPEVTNLATAPRAPAAADVAAFLRALFPERWQREQATREQAQLLDVDALPRHDFMPLPSPS